MPCVGLNSRLRQWQCRRSCDASGSTVYLCLLFCEQDDTKLIPKVCSMKNTKIVTSASDVFWICLCLCAGYLKQLLRNLDGICWKDRMCDLQQLITTWIRELLNGIFAAVELGHFREFC